MKFLFIVSRFYPSRGGVQRHAYEVGRRLVDRGHEVVVLTEAEAESRAESCASVDGMEVHSLVFSKAGFLKKFRIWARMLRPDVRAHVEWADVVVCHDVFFWFAPLRLIYPGKFVLTVFHGYETVFPPARKAIWIRRLSNWLSQRSIHVGNYIAKWYGTRADATLLTPGVRQSAGTGQTGNMFQIERGDTQRKHTSRPLQILLVGRLAEDMGIPVYLEAFSKLRTLGIPFHLEVCGDGPHRPQLEKYGTVHGMVDDPAPYMKNADVVCASGYLSLIEALQLDKACFAVYDNELKKDYLEDSFLRDWVWIGNNADELASQLSSKFSSRESMLNPEESKFLQKELKKHSWDAVTDTYIDLCTRKK